MKIRERLDAELARRTVDDVEQITRMADLSDAAQEAQAVRLSDSLAAKTRRERMAIRAAMMRLDRGTYGLCTGCGVEIGDRRLDLIPWAALCVRCQQDREAQ